MYYRYAALQDMQNISGFGISLALMAFMVGMSRILSAVLLEHESNPRIASPQQLSDVIPRTIHRDLDRIGTLRITDRSTTTEIHEVINNLRPQFDKFRQAINRSLDEGREIGYVIDNKYRLTGPFIGTAKGVTYDLTKEELEYMDSIGTFHTHIEREKPVPSRMNWMWMGIRGDKILCVGGKGRERYYLYVAVRKQELPTGEVKIEETTIPLD